MHFLQRSELEDLVHRRADEYWAALRHKNILIKRREERDELTMRAKLLERGNVNVRVVLVSRGFLCAVPCVQFVWCVPLCPAQELVTVLRGWPTPDHCPGAFKELIADLITNMFKEKKAGTVPVLQGFQPVLREHRSSCERELSSWAHCLFALMW